MSKVNTADKSTQTSMQDVDEANEAQPQEENATAASASAAVPSAGDARAARVARRSQLRDEAERDATVQGCKREDSLASKAAARESRRPAAFAAAAVQWRSFGP